MKKTIRSFCNFFVTIFAVIVVLYISFFTDIPSKTGNTVRLKIEEAKTEYEQYNESFEINELTINMNSYYYDKLTDSQKKIYDSIANAVKNFQCEFAIRDYKASSKEEFANEVSIAIAAFINDHPEVFYLQSQYSTYTLTGFDGNIGYIKLNYTESTIEEVNTKIDMIKQKIQEYISGTENLSDYEKELYIHDKLAQNVTYSDLEDLPRAYHTAEGPFLENIGVCDGFTKTLQILYDQVGIDSIIVLGVLDGNPHAWNLVNIDGDWYHVDLTSSRSIVEETGIITHAYFNLSDERMLKNASFDNPELLPKANTLDYNYYIYNDYVVYSNESINSKLSNIYKDFENKNYIEFYLEGNVSETISSILVALRRIDNSFLNGSKMYYYNIENAIIIPKN